MFYEDGPVNRIGHSATVMGDKMYIFGGVDLFGVVLKDLWSYDFQSGTWTRLADAPLPRFAANMAPIIEKNSIWVHGGADQNQEIHSDVWIYSLKFKKWKNWTPEQSPKRALSSTAHILTGDNEDNTVIFVYGGQSNITTFVDDWSVFVVSTKSWVSIPNAKNRAHPEARAAAVLGYTINMDRKNPFVKDANDQLTFYVIGGAGENLGPIPDLWGYNIVKDYWFTAGCYPGLEFPYCTENCRYL
jgi:hypothetical protein